MGQFLSLRPLRRLRSVPMLLFFPFQHIVLSPLPPPLSNHSSLLPRFQDWSHSIKILRMALALCSRTHLHHHPRTATIHWRARWASPTGPLHMIPLRGEADYPTITLSLSLDPRRRLPLLQMEMNPMTATQSTTEFFFSHHYLLMTKKEQVERFLTDGVWL